MHVAPLNAVAAVTVGITIARVMLEVSGLATELMVL